MGSINKFLKSFKNSFIINTTDYNFDELNNIENRQGDIRSIAFYAFGQSKITNKNTVLIVDGNYISNVYTVLTEAWFQKTNLIVLAFYNSFYDIKNNYLDRCTVSNITFFLDDYDNLQEEIENKLNLIGPKVFNIVGKKVDYKKNNYKLVINELDNITQKTDIIYAFNSDDINCNCEFKNILSKYQYGILSKYLAYTTINENKRILICDNKSLELDSNIFNCRYMNNNFKVIVIGNINRTLKWISTNNIEFIKCQNLKEDINKFYYSNKPTILNIEEGI